MVHKKPNYKPKQKAPQPKGVNLAGLLTENERKYLVGLKKELQK